MSNDSANDLSTVLNTAEHPDREQATERHDGRGIGGFLIFVAVGLVLSLLSNIGNFLQALGLARQLWVRTSPESVGYNPYWKPLLIYEIASATLILLANGLVFWLFFWRKRIFPKAMVVLIPTIFALGAGAHFLSGLIPAVAQTDAYARAGHGLIWRFIALHIWIPYFLLSTRVQETFVRPMKDPNFRRFTPLDLNPNK